MLPFISVVCYYLHAAKLTFHLGAWGHHYEQFATWLQGTYLECYELFFSEDVPINAYEIPPVVYDELTTNIFISLSA